MADETATTTDTATSQAATTQTSDTGATGATDTGSVLGDAGAQEAAPAAPAADPTATDPNAPPAAALPEKYEFTLEGFTPDAEILTAADPVLRELGLSNEAANKLAPLAQQIVQRTTDNLVQQLQDGAAAQKKEWLDAYQADPEIGGANKAQTEARAAKALDALGFVTGHPFREALNQSGFGNHPDMIRVFARLGEMVSEDNTFARPNTGAAQQKTAAQRLYPND